MATKQLLIKSLQRTYDRVLFAKEVLNPVFGSGFTLFSKPVLSNEQPNNTELQVILDPVYKYGEIILEDGTEVNCFEITLQPKVRIEQSRIAIQHFVRKLLTVGQAALVNFVSPSTDNIWRFTLVAKDSEITEDGIKEKTTHSKRYTYLVEKERPNRTLAERLENLSLEKVIDFGALVKAFSVETMSKEFFAEYKHHYQNFVEYLTGKRMVKVKGKWVEKQVAKASPFLISIFNNNEKDARDFNKKLLGRIVFLYFVQKKRWLGASSTEYTDGSYDFIYQLFEETGGDSRFFPLGLTELFFNVLNKKRPDDDYTTPNGETVKIPYLNGGLFTRDEVDGILHKKGDMMAFPPKLFSNPDLKDVPFERGFLDFLNAFNFTVYEDSPDDHTVAVDPEMLGHIFENLLEDNKDKGAYYTPKEIVSYMCRESLTEYLVTHLSKEFKVYRKIGNGQVELFGNEVKSGQLSTIEELGNKALDRKDVEQTVKDKSIADLTDKQIVRINQLLDDVKICDPAIGSGAFPMGLLQEIFTIKEMIAYKLRWDWKPEEVKEHIIQNSIYGVDIEKGAVDIARLRFWLSLIVDIEKPKALPNLDYKIMVGNSLVSKLGDDIIDIDWTLNETSHGLFGAELAIHKTELLKKLSKEQKEFFNPKNDKKKMAADIQKLKIDLLINQLELMVKTEGIETRPSGNGKAIAKQTKRYLQTLGWIQHIEKLKKLKAKPEVPLHFFDWKLDFPEVMNGQVAHKAGFDILIGNPPYVRADNPEFAELREQIMSLGTYETLWEKWDLMVAFIEKGLKLLSSTGNFSFIVSNSITTSKFSYKLQDWIIENYHLKSIDYFENIKVFDAGVIPVILSITTNKNHTETIKNIRNSSFENNEAIRINTLNLNNEFARAILFKKRYDETFCPIINTIRLGDICYLSYGLRPNSDERFWKGEFSKDDVISDTKTKIYSKEYVEGKDIKEYKIKRIKYLEWNTERIPKKLVRPTFRNLYVGEKILRGRVTKGTFDDTGIVCNDSIVVMKRFVDLKGVNERSITSSISKNNLDKEDKVKSGSQKKSALNRRRKELERISANYLLKYILAVINSKYAMAYLNNYRRHRLENYFYPDDFRNYPLPVIEITKQKQFENLVNQILFLKSEDKDTTAIEQQIDNMVYKLYELTYEGVKVIDPEFPLSEAEYEKIQ